MPWHGVGGPLSKDLHVPMLHGLTTELPHPSESSVPEERVKRGWEIRHSPAEATNHLSNHLSKSVQRKCQNSWLLPDRRALPHLHSTMDVWRSEKETKWIMTYSKPTSGLGEESTFLETSKPSSSLKQSSHNNPTYYLP